MTISWGVNGHTSQDPAQLTAWFRALQARGLTRYRTDIFLTDDHPNEAVMFRNMVNLAKTFGITLLPIIHVPFEFGNNRTDNGKYPLGDYPALYSQGYDRTKEFVTQFLDVQDWEMQNELNLLVLDASGSPLFGKGWTEAEFNTALMRDWGAVLHGMTVAIDDINTSNSTHLRRILTTTSTMFGFLEFMVHQCAVKAEVFGYHYYEHKGINPHQYWGGVNPTFDLFTKLSTYGRPLIFGEFNAGEIYDPVYLNMAGDPSTENGFISLRDIINYLQGSGANILHACFYQHYDDQLKTGAESRFGLVYPDGTPKVALYLAARAAGVTLATTELAELSSRNL